MTHQINSTESLHAYLQWRGFTAIGTGGNCQAFQQFFDDDGKWEVLITHHESPELPVYGDEMRATLWDRDSGDMLADSEDYACGGFESGSLAAVMHFWEFIAGEIIADIAGED